MDDQTAVRIENSPVSRDELSVALDGFAAAFSRTLSDETKVQYYHALGGLMGEQLRNLFTWAVEMIDSPLPSIARLRKRAVELRWMNRETAARGNGEAPGNHRTRGRDTTFVEVVCPRCEGTFVVPKSNLDDGARAGAVFECANRLHWGCSITFRAAELVEEPAMDRS